jgi:hypothetical protein
MMCQLKRQRRLKYTDSFFKSLTTGAPLPKRTSLAFKTVTNPCCRLLLGGAGGGGGGGGGAGGGPGGAKDAAPVAAAAAESAFILRTLFAVLYIDFRMRCLFFLMESRMRLLVVAVASGD